jgi:hypothetical protein
VIRKYRKSRKRQREVVVRGRVIRNVENDAVAVGTGHETAVAAGIVDCLEILDPDLAVPRGY